MKEDNYWHIISVLRIDRNKYKGKGRPRKTDYKLWTEEAIFEACPKWPKDNKFPIVGMKGYYSSVGE